MNIASTMRIHSVEQDMTAEEIKLFKEGRYEWGTAAARVRRGSAYLDRVMPGWESKVEIKLLDLSDTCKCVLGQIFTSELSKLAEQDLEDDGHFQVIFASGETQWVMPDDKGYGLGVQILGLVEATQEMIVNIDAAIFFGFDHSSDASYSDLSYYWKEAISHRQNAGA